VTEIHKELHILSLHFKCVAVFISNARRH
jgi:hypothetical protein